MLKSQRLPGEQGLELDLPTEAVSFFKGGDDGSWILTHIETSSVKRERVPLSEMRVPAENPVIVVNPAGEGVRAGFVNEFSAENLDSIVDRLFAAVEKGQSKIPAERSRTKQYLYFVLFNAGIAAIWGLYYYLSRRSELKVKT
jgi:hypothetical protein